MFFVDWKSKIDTTTKQRFNIGPYEKMKKIKIFYESQNLIESSLYINSHWIVIIFCVAGNLTWLTPHDIG